MIEFIQAAHGISSATSLLTEYVSYRSKMDIPVKINDLLYMVEEVEKSVEYFKLKIMKKELLTALKEEMK